MATELDPDILADFCAEAEGLIGKLEDDVGRVRACVYSAAPLDMAEYVQFLKQCDPAAYLNQIRSINRALHTVKGLSGFLELAQLGRYCHALEELTTGIASGELILDEGAFAVVSRSPGVLARVLETVAKEQSDAGVDLSAEMEEVRQCRAAGLVLMDGATLDLRGLAAGDKDLGKVRAPKRSISLSVDLDDYDDIVQGFQSFSQDVAALLEAERVDPEVIHQVRQGMTEHLDKLVQVSRSPMVLSRYPRIVLDLSKHLGKDAAFHIKANTALARPDIWERCHNALVHLVRNAVDHGIEEPEVREALGKKRVGRIELEVTEDHRNVYIHLTDDGGGIDPERVGKLALEKGVVTQGELDAMDVEARQRLIFRAGFSTRAVVTSTSGRGVGMDAVLEEIEGALGGRLVLRSEKDVGTSVRLEVPKAETLSECIVFAVEGTQYAIPKPPEVTYVDCDARRLRPVPGASPVYNEGDAQASYPVLDLSPLLLETPAPAGPRRAGILVKITEPSGTFALLVPEVVGHRKLKIERRRALNKLLRHDGMVFGCALSDPVIVALDVEHLKTLL
ncbi:MAG: hypothetical protein HGA98_00525 [Deltaproteobacteria bacterium]|nr:hypothetical protein [Deltaproteobacteria bacterium]